VCVYIYIYIYIYIYTHIHTHTHAYLKWVRPCVCTFMYTIVCTYIRKHAHTYIHTHTRISERGGAPSVHITWILVCTYIRKHVHTHTYLKGVRSIRAHFKHDTTQSPPANVHKTIHTYAHTYICTYIHMQNHTYICTYAPQFHIRISNTPDRIVVPRGLLLSTMYAMNYYVSCIRTFLVNLKRKVL
jgi:hypothetical protein